MTAIDRTAYPRLKQQLSDKELSACYDLGDNERAFIRRNTRQHRGQLIVAVMLKTRQQLGYFINLETVPMQIINYLAKELNIPVKTLDTGDIQDKKTLYRYRAACRKYLGSKSLSQNTKSRLLITVNRAAYTMSDPADLINVVLEELNNANIELPAFSTLDRWASHERQIVHDKLYQQITGTLTAKQCHTLDELLVIPADDRMTGFSQLKQTPGPATLKHFRAWANRLSTLTALLDPKPCFKGIAFTKIRQFAAQASAHSIGDIRGVLTEPKRHTLLLSLLYQTQTDTRDQLIEMFLKRMRQVQHNAQENLRKLQEKHRDMEEELISVLGRVLQYAGGDNTDEVIGHTVRQILNDQGGVEKLNEQFNLVAAFHQNNYFPFLWQSHSTNRAVIFRVLNLIEIKSSTQDKSLLNGLAYVHQHQRSRKDLVPQEISLSFASYRWKRFVESKSNPSHYDRRALEICVFIHFAEALQNGDLFIEDSGAYSDHRKQLLSLDECRERLPDYCQSLGLPASSHDFVNSLRDQLTQLAVQIDKSFPENTEFTIDHNGVPHLKRQKASPLPDGLYEFKKTVYKRLPERHLLDILKNTHHWTKYTKHFGPPSGSDRKLSDSTRRYLFAVFGYGCNLGASQTARHAPENINRQTLRRLNAEHINSVKLESALNDIIGEYARFELPKFWGKSNVAIADGTHIELRKNNLLGEQHIRFGRFGGIAYHHISSEYIALFSHFIGCGVWEAVYILDALLLNKSVYQPDTLHADTHGQSEPVFSLAYLLGINLYPRMRTWNDVAFYRPDAKTKYKHIDSLFTKTTNWDLIETHWMDMMQVVLSIQAGKVLPSMLLRKLNSNNRRNKLYRAFRELGRVIRTLFLLRYISESDFRQTIRAETTKVESYNDFLDWVSFGGQVIKSGDPVVQAKQIKYMNLVANSIMLQNVVDLTDVLTQMDNEGITITKELAGGLSPYIRDQIRRFGRYDMNTREYPPPLNPISVPISENA